MARARMLKHGFFLNEELAELKPIVRLLYAGLWTIADREGRLEDRPKRIKASVLPWDNLDADAALDDLQDAGFVQRYEILGRRYIAIPTWHRHQHPHVREPASTIPAPPGHEPSIVRALVETGAEHGHSTGSALDEHDPGRAESESESESVNGVLEKKEKRDSSFSLDPEIARASQTDATPTEQAKLKHSLGSDRPDSRKQRGPADIRDLVGNVAAVAAAGVAKRGGT